MSSILNAYLYHGPLINCIVLVVLVIMSACYHAMRTSHRRGVQTAQFLWVTAALVLILVMTLSRSTPWIPISMRSLHSVSHIPPTVHRMNWRDPIGNVLMTIPLATALALTWSRRRTILAVCALSTTIEITQHFYGHGRNSQLSDILLNTLGGALGVGIAALGAAIATRTVPNKVNQDGFPV